MQQLTQLIKPSIVLENTIREQCFNQFHDEEKMCAVSVLNEAIRETVCSLGQFDEHVDSVGEKFDCPCCPKHINAYLGGIIMHLNDNHKCTFKEIAIWLRSVGH